MFYYFFPLVVKFKVSEDCERPRVAELVAKHVKEFSCSHVAKAIPTTTFGLSMANRLYDYCTDADKHLDMIKSKLGHRDIDLLTSLLSQKLQIR
jgi:hypothetical protein